MKGNISLGEFIRGVKAELVRAANDRKDDPFFALTDVELEASFSLEIEGETSFSFVVAAKGATTAGQVHKVTMKFKPIGENASEQKDASSVQYLTIPKEHVRLDPNSSFVTIPYSAIGGRVRRPGTVDFGSVSDDSATFVFDPLAIPTPPFTDK